MASECSSSNLFQQGFEDARRNNVGDFRNLGQPAYVQGVAKGLQAQQWEYARKLNKSERVLFFQGYDDGKFGINRQEERPRKPYLEGYTAGFLEWVVFTNDTTDHVRCRTEPRVQQKPMLFPFEMAIA